MPGFFFLATVVEKLLRGPITHPAMLDVLFVRLRFSGRTQTARDIFQQTVYVYFKKS